MESSRTQIEKILKNETPSRVLFAPNYWQWFAYQKNHGILPEEISHCNTQLDLINFLGADVFSRNTYSKQDDYWFGGICDEVFEDTALSIKQEQVNKDKVTVKTYNTKSGPLSETLLYIFKEATVVQKEFLISDYDIQGEAFERFVAARKWIFNREKYDQACTNVGESGFVIIGDFYSPLKMLHLAMGPINSVYFLLEKPEQAKVLLDLHEKAQLDAITQCVQNGARVIMSMDNLDTMFHPPDFVERYSASFYEKASSICHENGAKFFIHACGHQKANLKLISSLNVDGLEGVAFPPLGDVELEEAMQLTHNRFIITGGISAMETRDLKNREDIFKYVENLFSKLRPYRNRFIFSASCNTSIDAKWETIKYFRDAWREYGSYQ